MNKCVLLLALAISSSAFADAKYSFAGSDTLAGALTDAIIAAGMDSQMQYAGGGSGLGEKGLLTGDQGIAPMSRPMTEDAMSKLKAQGASVVDHVLALDGLSMFVQDKSSVSYMDLQTLARIYTCEFTKWEQIPGSGARGVIKAYRRNDTSGTTDAFKMFTGVKTFGACVTVVAETADIADVTSRDPMAIGYAGLSGKVEHNRALAIAAKPGSSAVMPTTASVRDFSYPMARKLFVFEVTGTRTASALEKDFLSYITDRSFMDPIMQAHDFITID